MRKYSFPQILAFVLSWILPPVSVWFTEGFGVDFWINVLLTILGFIPGSIHATYIWIVWTERKWQTHHGHEVSKHPFLVFSKEFEVRSRWKGNGQDGFFGYFDDNIKGGHGANMVGGDVDREQARPIQKQQQVAV
ncbi:Plasma membrane proteolipid [Lachnellula suecica]|uniref:Plasma membrane proteolipid n=1 Tax=Lachnellula suecica TaxID=602035 RepID=A0A8T9CE96_9HELO|nr:Plasma membrane proteolipid [Lachnellula suecica]